ncbi:MAG: transcription antitermination factor NusB [Clostridia bacterium]|nr:transcription antitermination factor NusB [Clostridia bacterium]
MKEMTRSEGRNLAFELLYSLEIQKVEKEERQEQIQLFLQESEIEEERAVEYIEQTINGIFLQEAEIEKMISQNLKEKWDIGRISKVNLALLKLGIYEMVYSKLPYKVVVNEVVELAKKYGEDTSPSFVNGILANIIKQQGL